MRMPPLAFEPSTTRKMLFETINIKSIYVESSIFGPLTSRPNPLPHIAATQQATVEWWNFHRHDYELYVSDLVLREIAQRDQVYAEMRLRLAEKLNRLPISEEIQAVAQNSLISMRFPTIRKKMPFTSPVPPSIVWIVC